MKKLLVIALALSSLQAFAFTSVKVSSAVTLDKNNYSKTLSAIISANKGSDYCIASISSTDNVDQMVVAAGTNFEVVSIIQNGCGQDWGRQCRLDVEAYNKETNLSLLLTCKNRGIFARELTVAKVNQISNGKIVVK